MKIVIKDNRRFILRFDKGEEVISGLQDFMAREQIKACSFYALGTAGEIELGFFNVHIKNYRRKKYLEELEIASMLGNGAISQGDGKPAVHAHGVFSRTDFTSLAGHVFLAKALATCEVFLIVLDGEMKRANNPEFNLNLLI